MYREEAIEAQNRPSYGHPISGAILSNRYFFVYGLAVILFICFFLVYGRYRERISIIGQLSHQPESVTLSAPYEGYVKEVFFARDNDVAEDAVIVKVATEDISLSGRNSKEAIRKVLSDQMGSASASFREKELNNANALRLAERRYELALEASAGVAAQVRIRNEKIRIAAEKQRYYQQLKATKLVTAADVEQATQERLAEEIALQALITSQKEYGSEIASIESQMEEIKARKIEERRLYEMEGDKNYAELLRAQQNEGYALTAPIAGTVVFSSIHKNSRVKKGQVLVEIKPKQSQIIGVASVPQRALINLNVGQRVNLELTSFPREKYGLVRGVVTEVSRAPESRIAGEEGASYLLPNSMDGSFQVKIRIEPENFERAFRPEDMRSGMLFSASVVSVDIPLYAWIASKILQG